MRRKVGRLFLVEEAAEYLRVNPQTIRRWVREKRLQGFWSGRRLVFPEKALQEFLAPVGGQK
jgi:excisionase family DNA binding protein